MSKKVKTEEQQRISALQSELRKLKFKANLKHKINKAREAIKSHKGVYPLWINGAGDCINLTADLAEKVIDLIARENKRPRKRLVQ